MPYGVIVFYLMFFGMERHQMEDNIVRVKPVYSTIMLVKEFIFWNYWYDAFINFFGNLFLFVPFGFLGWLLPKYNDLKSLMIYFLSAIIILEALQYFTRLGVFDIDDIILNGIGVIIGFYLKEFYERWINMV